MKIREGTKEGVLLRTKPASVLLLFPPTTTYFIRESLIAIDTVEEETDDG